ncbi:hypothetical protein AWH56_010650 [Anaerobacillus isosaccharinicus]|uniref:Uncharacterized protein n=1 Tax=Anaerobacillus isosaccharinicus TaxID=1532552 RepID=A0A1S2L7D6_9BACI|nr:hypothetical protein [Anaerobacillus isosaccharinicus]MBA5588610.1 hypothetical protein [Anaerobacillus isosaccharinicus]QOY37979.1 hypothetical protein AWH56_010650 [Anaerobacillus isosaccharinicus]
MELEEKKQLRLKILEELYEIYFKTGRGKGTLNYLKFEDMPTRTAYEYLINKGLISEKHESGNNFNYKITVVGIDLVEGSIAIPGL